MIDFENIGNVFIWGVALGFAYTIYKTVKGWVTPKPDPVGDLAKKVQFLEEKSCEMVPANPEAIIWPYEESCIISIDVSDILKQFAKKEKAMGIDPKSTTGSGRPFLKMDNDGKFYLVKNYNHKLEK